MTTSCNNIRVVVGIDFGTTYSGFSYANVANPSKIEANDDWPERKGEFKTNTVIRYDNDLELVKWGFPALAEKSSRRRSAQSNNSSKVAELFKLHLGKVAEGDRPPLPTGLDPKKAVTDYLREIGKLIKNKVSARWPGLIFHKHVRIVLTVPVEYDEKIRAIMRQCAFDAGLILTLESENLEFTTEPEAAAIYCLENLNEHPLKVGESFMIVDCGGGTVDLTVRTLLPNTKLSELTESTGEFCGSAYIDKEFKKFLARKIGKSTLQLIEKKHYPELQYLIQHFCTNVKILFDGNEETWRSKELDLESVCPIMLQYVNGEERAALEESEWLIELDFETIKHFFDQVIAKILLLIRQQLTDSGRDISAIFMVGGFSESKYLLHRVRQEFSRQVPYIAVPSYPVASVVKGAAIYGLRMDIIKTRVLKKTYGIELYRDWTHNDPLDQKKIINSKEKILFFKRLAKKGTEVNVDQEFKNTSWPSHPTQETSIFEIYTTNAEDGNNCDEPGMKLFGKLELDLPDVNLGTNRPVEFTLTFGKMETRAIARNLTTGSSARANFKLEL
ncbi:3583_t:CDS:2 [Ambispora gerdemannii]|uniref:3583_t:CDS:1 n=1 Tax=Ambispora gerdemannii TaxID=144530 RepID=A0A9N9H7B7_9GLOM|nr:3583_t:CDS:2 [Ambispora gerdemannii]